MVTQITYQHVKENKYFELFKAFFHVDSRLKFDILILSYHLM